MKTIIFATNNLNKVIEVRSLLDKSFNIMSLKEGGINIDIAEPFDTLTENAIEKSNAIYKLTQQNCFSEDTGLEVTSLNGEPGVQSARYAGANRSSEENINKLLINLRDKMDRSARFKTVIALTVKGKHKIFEGECKGTIIAKRRGNLGFGYDSVFIPDGAEKTFAEMTLNEKNIYSHRRKAFEKLLYYLNNHNNF